MKVVATAYPYGEGSTPSFTPAVRDFDVVSGSESEALQQAVIIGGAVRSAIAMAAAQGGFTNCTEHGYAVLVKFRE